MRDRFAICTRVLTFYHSIFARALQYGLTTQSQWNRQLKHQQYRRIRLTATGSQAQSYLLRTLRGKLNKLPFEVCVLISKRHHRDKHPKYFLCTDLSLSAQKALSCYQKRWSIEVDNFFVKQFLGLTDFRVQCLKQPKNGLPSSSWLTSFCNGVSIMRRERTASPRLPT